MARLAGEQTIELRHVYHVFCGGTPRRPFLALRDVNLDVRPGEFVTLLGPSGCGKSTVLNMVAGLVAPTRGDVTCLGRRVQGPNVGMGYVTQDDNLLPWRSVIDNAQLGLEYQGVPRAERRARALELIHRVGLGGFENHFPHQLSGGMRKRVSIIRTLAVDPAVLLMDEPFGPLDAQTRTLLQDELLKLWSGSGKAVLFVTHDLVESIALSDRIVLFGRSPGHIKAIYEVPIPRPRDVFHIHAAPGFNALHDRLWRDLQEEMARPLATAEA